ncbi:hemerythrin domain-containing protein [Denitratisoma sp. agr-D3]
MTTSQTLQRHHQHCDTLFAIAEATVADGEWERAEAAQEAFCLELERHFQCEEEELFPAFEAATGMTQGPTRVMRLEHGQMRDLLGQMNQALTAQDAAAFADAAETLLILMQQHNMKEENILYPLFDQRLPAAMAAQVEATLDCPP